MRVLRPYVSDLYNDFLHVWTGIAVVLMLLITGCATEPMVPAASPAVADAVGASTAESAAPTRPGLATAWGENVDSSVSFVSFERAAFDSPDRVIAIYYNNRAGLGAMTGGFERAREQAFEILDGAIRFGITDEDRAAGQGRFWAGLALGNRYFVQGEQGARYGIYLENRSPARLEMVASVDGLDVIDGRPAAFSKRGYILNPNEHIVIEGFRRSADQVAAFRFGTVAESYAAQKHADTRNVGVIGLALFRARGSAPLTVSAREAHTRLSANPFPGRFATPP
ncbi:MAG: hypothetical protein U1F68_03940 [Gammaproteobacteria bacterium]